MSTTAQAQEEQMSLWLKGITTVLVIYTPNQLHFPTSLGLPVLNVLNVICLILWGSHLLSRRPSSPAPPLYKVILFWFAALTYGFVLAQVLAPGDFMRDMFDIKQQIFYPLYFFIFYSVARTNDDIRFFVYAILIVAIVAGCEAIREWIAFGASSYKHTARAAGPFGIDYRNANRAGAFYAIFLPMAFVFALSAENWRKIMWWVCLSGPPIIVMAIFATYSRQAYAIAALSAVIFSLRRGVIAVVPLVVLAATHQLWLPTTAVERVSETQSVDEEGVEGLDNSTESRFIVWGGAMRMLGSNPAGVGLNRFRDHIGRYVPEYYEGYDAHNFYVLMLAEIGPIGAGALATLAISLLVLGFKLAGRAKRHEDKFGRAMGFSLTLMSINMMLTNLYGSPFAMGEVMGLYWAFAGLCARRLQNINEGVPVLGRQPTSDCTPPEPPVVKTRPRRLRPQIEAPAE
jgi:hypothetical protein